MSVSLCGCEAIAISPAKSERPCSSCSCSVEVESWLGLEKSDDALDSAALRLRPPPTPPLAPPLSFGAVVAAAVVAVEAAAGVVAAVVAVDVAVTGACADVDGVVDCVGVSGGDVEVDGPRTRVIVTGPNGRAGFAAVVAVAPSFAAAVVVAAFGDLVSAGAERAFKGASSDTDCSCDDVIDVVGGDCALPSLPWPLPWLGVGTEFLRGTLRETPPLSGSTCN